MNTVLLQEIINHVFYSFSILKNNNVNNKFKSLNSPEFLLQEKLSFEDDQGNSLSKKVWGVQFKIENNTLKILLADCSIDKDILEYALLVKLEDNPAYGLYSAYSLTDKPVDGCPLIAVSVSNNNWMKCNTYFQATFLAGMESAKDVSYTASNCSDYSDHFALLTSFIKYHNDLYGDSFER